MLSFNLKDKYYQMYLRGEKDTEYRKHTEYWVSRLTKLKIGDKVKLSRGYRGEFIMAKIVSIDIIHYKDLPDYLKDGSLDNYLDRYQSYYAVKLDVDKYKQNNNKKGK